MYFFSDIFPIHILPDPRGHLQVWHDQGYLHTHGKEHWIIYPVPIYVPFISLTFDGPLSLFFISLIYWYLNWAQILICCANRKLYKKYYNFTCIGYKRCIWIWYQIYIITCTTQSFVRHAAISNLLHWTYLCLF